MTYLSLKWRIQIVMCGMCLVLAAILVHGRNSLPIPLNETTIGLMVGGAFLISVLLGIAWQQITVKAED